VGFQDSETWIGIHLTHTQRRVAVRVYGAYVCSRRIKNFDNGAGPAVRTVKKYKKFIFLGFVT